MYLRCTASKALAPRRALQALGRVRAYSASSCLATAPSTDAAAPDAQRRTPIIGMLPPAIATHTIDTKLAHTIDTNRLFAVVALGASQYKVTPGDVLIVDKIRGAEVGTFVTLNNVLLVGSAGKTVVGRPLIESASVKAFVEEQARDAKVVVFKKKRRKGYKRWQGHRRQITVLRIAEVACDGHFDTFSVPLSDGVQPAEYQTDDTDSQTSESESDE